jgi:molybdopterin synthase sulfur carrier subunit
MKIEISVKLFAYFRDNRFSRETRLIDEGTTVGNIVDSLNIDRKEVGVLMVNSRHREFDYALQSDDILAIFPVVGGG